MNLELTQVIQPRETPQLRGKQAALVRALAAGEFGKPIPVAALIEQTGHKTLASFRVAVHQLRAKGYLIRVVHGLGYYLDFVVSGGYGHEPPVAPGAAIPGIAPTDVGGTEAALTSEPTSEA